MTRRHPQVWSAGLVVFVRLVGWVGHMVREGGFHLLGGFVWSVVVWFGLVGHA